MEITWIEVILGLIFCILLKDFISQQIRYVIELNIAYPIQETVQESLHGKLHTHNQENLGSMRNRSRLSPYAIKEENLKDYGIYGKGLVVVICNFTSELVGYEKDAKRIEKFFTNIQYVVQTFKNCSTMQFKTIMTETQKVLNSNGYDRFFLFVLSHGDTNGITFCEPCSSVKDEHITENEIRGEDLVKLFSHDKIPNMANYPKCIILQTCSGVEYVRSAVLTNHSPYNELMKINTNIPGNGTSDGQNLQQTNIPVCQSTSIGVDIILCHASDKETMSWVSKHGSWYIRAIIEVFDELADYETVPDMMTEVTNRLACKKGIEKASGKMTCQLPVFENYLSRKFYLKLPM